MNERNVEALTEALVRYAERNGSRRDDALPSSRRIAEAVIASDGVLVPGALTDEQFDGAAFGCYGDYLAGVPDYDRGRAALDHIARGEIP